MSDIKIREDFLPAIIPTEVCLFFKKKRNLSCYNGGPITSTIADHHTCDTRITAFEGLFAEVGFGQRIIEDKQLTGVPDTAIVNSVAEYIANRGGPMRLAIRKYMDDEGKFRYGKYVDFDATKVIELGGQDELRRIIYLLLHACDTAGMLVPKVKEDTWTTQKQTEQLNPPK